MHFAEDPLGAKKVGNTHISAAKVTSTLGDKYKTKGAAEVERMNSIKSRTLKQRITDKMPAWRKTIDFKADRESAARRKAPVRPFKSSLPDQEVYGVPGVSKKSQLPAKYR